MQMKSGWRVIHCEATEWVGWREGGCRRKPTYNFAATGAGVQLHQSHALMLNGETDDEIYITA